MSHDLKISSRTEKTLTKTQNTFQIQGGSKLEVFDDNGKRLYEGEFKSFTSNFLKLLYGSMVGAGTEKVKDLTNIDVEMDSFPQSTFNISGGSGIKKFGVVVGTNSTAVSASDYNIAVPETLTVNDTIVNVSTVGADLISVDISRQIGNLFATPITLHEAGLICGYPEENNSNVLIARDSLNITLESGKKSVWRYTINFNFANNVGGFVKAFADKMFNGIFEEATASAQWDGRRTFGCVVYEGKMWVMGGSSANGSLNDVWYSTDGVNWTQATSSADWPARDTYAVVFADKMWVMGGNNQNNIWYSTNGANWTQQVTSGAVWIGRSFYGKGVIEYNGKMWVMGGQNWPQGRLNDVWYSTNGANWTQATSSAAWSARSAFGCVVFDNKMWVMGGNNGSSTLNDVWYSTNGADWTQVISSAAWSARSTAGYEVFDNKMWVMGGSNQNDVWTSKNLISEIKPGSSDSAFSATGTTLGALITDGSGSGELVYGAMPGAATTEPTVSGNKTKFSIAREFTNNSGADITVREVGLFSGSDMLARLILAAPVTIANGDSEVLTIDFETEV